jgi:hypothetical protein
MHDGADQGLQLADQGLSNPRATPFQGRLEKALAVTFIPASRTLKDFFCRILYSIVQDRAASPQTRHHPAE